MFDKLFIDHPQTVDETYGEHFRTASGFGFRLLLAGFACLVHAVVPGLFVRTGSDAIRELHHRMVTHRRPPAAAAESAEGAASHSLS